MHRRSFIHHMSLGAAGMALQPSFPGTSKNAAANKLVLSLIGCGGRGLDVLAGIVKENENMEVKYLCDVNETLSGIKTAIDKYNTIQGYAPKFTGNMKQVFDDKDVDAVIIATPEHWHALAAIWALQAGKHVYVEKNPTLSIWEGQQMIAATKKYKKVLQIGFQNRSAPYAFSAREYIKSGKLGKVLHVKCYNMLPGGKWIAKPDTDVPKGLNWDAWLGPARKVPYNPNRHSMTGRGGWLDFWDYGGGALSDDASHVMDLARLAMGDPGHPKSVYCTGGNVGFQSQKETPEFLNITYDYGDFDMTCESGSCTPYMTKEGSDVRFGTKWPYWPQNSTRIEIYGTERLMYLGRHGVGWQVMEVDGKIVDMDKGYFPDKFHQKNFIDSIRLQQEPNGDVTQGHLSASLVHLADICYRTGKKQLFLDRQTEKFINNEAANKFLKGNYRAPYIIPEKL
ncbi:Gfo/Idh/MocA family oxidoreductase [Agriterribacter sp.]|uniref:Gfo/Idh/MocA family protein n=1 Tax=Agriterribacter sp. TaxID=2821509 RepID=UPI002CE04DF3|nr:Gfo/Idh/MocA family oxidoreductase [Agriterribacter sp.]HRP54553.1 Gfo/Idh/MocA family oxidoreductase [Agriterribacter sp.]